MFTFEARFSGIASAGDFGFGGPCTIKSEEQMYNPTTEVVVGCIANTNNFTLHVAQRADLPQGYEDFLSLLAVVNPRHTAEEGWKMWEECFGTVSWTHAVHHFTERNSGVFGLAALVDVYTVDVTACRRAIARWQYLRSQFAKAPDGHYHNFRARPAADLPHTIEMLLTTSGESQHDVSNEIYQMRQPAAV